MASANFSGEPAVDRLMTIPEVAEALRTTEQGVRWAIHKKTAPRSALINGRRLFRESDVQAHIDAAFAEKASA